MIDKAHLKNFYNTHAFLINKRKNKYYHQEILEYYKFTVLKNSRILELGCGNGDLIGKLKPSYGIGVDISEKMIEIAKNNHPEINFICQDIEEFESNEEFDYIILSGTLTNVENIQVLMQKIYKIATPDTRIIIDYYNELWRPIISLGKKISFKSPEIINNWLSIDDIANFLHISNFQVIKHKFFLLFPVNIPVISFLINKVIGNLPIIRRFSLSQILVSRKFCMPDNKENLSISVVYTVRDEEGNIEELIKRTPRIGRHTELIFVEGHSKDKTVEKIQECIIKYPQKDIKLYKQKDIGQKDAYRLGFDKANGDFVCWLEADLTTPPEQIKLLWDVYISGQGEYINGSRFVYKMGEKAMPFLNMIGNRFFGNLFTILLGQRFTDTLCGFKAISKKNYLKIRNNIDYFGDFDPFGDFELIFNVIKLNIKVAEVPVHYQERTYGESKAYGKTTFSFIKHALLLLRMSWIALWKFK